MPEFFNGLIPFGDTQDIEDEIVPLLFGSLETSVEILRLYGAVIATLHVNVEHLHRRAQAGFTTVTELADTLVREAHISFRQAHSIVSGVVTYALANDLAPDNLTSDLLARIAQEKTGHEIRLSDAALRQALDPVAFVNKRSGYGGSAPSATATILDGIEAQIRIDREAYDGALGKLAQANHLLRRETDVIIAGL
jgi:argininosuccinate lyase